MQKQPTPRRTCRRAFARWWQLPPVTLLLTAVVLTGPALRPHLLQLLGC